MSKYLAICAVSLVIFQVEAARAEPFEPTASETLSIEQAIAPRLLDPASILISGLAASQSASDPALMIVCGKVRGKNAFGGYTQPTPFIGTLSHDASGSPIFELARIANPDQASQTAVYKLCAEKLKASS